MTAPADHARLANSAATLSHSVTGYGAVAAGPDLPVSVRNVTVDHDADADGLIEIDSLAKLNAVRWDLDGDGTASSGNETSYAAAFPNPRGGDVCPTALSGVACRGYELTTDLNFDTNGDGAVDADDPGSHPNWLPIGTVADGYAATFRGNGHVVDHLRLSSTTTRGVGLFAAVGSTGRVESVGVTNVDVTGYSVAGSIVGVLSGRLVASYATGRVAAVEECGGLVGRTEAATRDDARIVASYSAVAVSCSGGAGFHATSGGLVGLHANGAVVASYAVGSVQATDGNGGGLSGRRPGSALWVGALVDSYWDERATDQPASYATSQPGGATGDIFTTVATAAGAKSTAALQSPTDYTGIYANWRVDLDGDYEADDPWDFGTSSQYPSLKWGGFDPSRQFAVPEEEATDEDEDEAAPVNEPPEALAALSDATLMVGETLRVDLRGAFRDADGDPLTYSARSSGAAATAFTEDAVLVLEGVSDGVATVTVTATDPHGESAAQTLTVTTGVVLSLAGDNAAAAEGGVVRLEARLSAPRRTPTPFSWRVLADADAATPDADAGEHGNASGTATIAAGETMAELAIAIADDAEVEPAREWFVVELRSDAVALGRTRLAAAVLEGVCDRSPAVAAALSGRRGCAAPTDAELAAVRTLRLEGRGIEMLGAHDLAGLGGLRALMLRGNALAALPDGLLAAVPRLRSLNLGGNRLAALDEDEFADVAELRWLDLSDNALAALPGGVLAGLPELRWLRLDGNALETLPEGLFVGADSLRSARLADNPGAPFALRVELRRTDAALHAPGPATIRAEIAAGAPFAVRVGLSAQGGEIVSTGGSPAASGDASLASGETTGRAVLVNMAVPGAQGAVRVTATVGEVPQTICNGLPCWDGLALAAGEPLTLFIRPPTASRPPTPAPLVGSELRLPLDSLVSAGTLPLERWQASSSDPAVATAHILGGELVVEAVLGAEGEVEIEVTAVDASGLAAIVRFAVRVEFHWPARPGAGWRVAVGAEQARADE